MKTEIKNAILAGLAFGLLFDIYLSVHYGPNKYALVASLIVGVIFVGIPYFFIISKIVKNQTQIINTEGSDIIFSGGANHFKNGEGVGGKLYLLSDKLHFKSHDFNLQIHELIISLDKIKEVQVYNIFGFIPTGLAIVTNDGKVEKFAVNNRRRWRDEIEKFKKQNLPE